MRHYIKSILLTLAAFFATKSLVPTISMGPDFKNTALVLLGFWIISQVVNPIFSLVLLPINLLTFGMVALILNIAFLFALINFLPGFSIGAYYFPGAQIQGVYISPFSFNQIETVILFAAILTFLQKILHIIFE